MATYTYRCTDENCNHEFDTRHGMTEPNLTTCPECAKETLQKVISANPVHFKGGNWVTPGQK